MSVEIFVARHGQNEDNVNGILNGHRDLPLTDLGRQQARDLAQGIIDTGLKLDAIYCSPLSRAFETADIVAKTLGLQNPIVIEGLIERDFGIMTGKLARDIEKLCPPEDIIKIEELTYFLNAKDAEQFPDVIIRADKVLEDVRDRHSSGNVLLVCHGDIGKMIYAAATGKDWKEVLRSFHLGNAELIDLSGNGEAHVITFKQHNS